MRFSVIDTAANRVLDRFESEAAARRYVRAIVAERGDRATTPLALRYTDPDGVSHLICCGARILEPAAAEA